MMRWAASWILLYVLACIAGCGGTAKTTADKRGADPARGVVVPWEVSGIDWSSPPLPGPEPEFRVPEPAVFRLANGMSVVAVANRRLPLVSIYLVNPYGGGVYDPADLKGLAAITADMLDEGAGSRTALEVAGETERLGAYLSTSAGVDAAYLSVDTLTSTLEPSLALLAEVVAMPTFTEKDFQRVKGDRISLIKRRRDQQRAVASLIFDRVVFGGHAYGLPNSGTEESVAQITLPEVKQFYERHYSPDRMTVILVGDFDPAALRAVLEPTLGKWAQRPIEPNEPHLELPRSQKPRLIVSDRPGAKQSAVRIGRVGMRRRDARYFDAVVLNTVLGGSFTARLNNRLREELGYTYGAGSTFWFGRESGTWRTHSSIETEHTLHGIREMLKMIERLRRELVPAEELRRTKQLLVRQFPQAFESNTGIADSFTDLVVHELPLDWYRGYRSGIERASSERGREIAAATWGRGQLVLVVVGDLEKILEGLLGLGFGAALEVDPEGNPIRNHPAPGP